MHVHGAHKRTSTLLSNENCLTFVVWHIPFLLSCYISGKIMNMPLLINANGVIDNEVNVLDNVHIGMSAMQLIVFLD